MKLSNLFTACASLAFFAATAQASIVTQPTSLNPGDQYRLVFITDDSHNAVSTDIDVYNSFVSGVANGVPELANLSVAWKVIGATATVSARANTGTDPTLNGAGVPIFMLNNTRVAADYAGLWDGTLEADLNIDEHGNSVGQVRVWTGTTDDGLYQAQGLGNTPDTPLVGNSMPSAGTAFPAIPGANGWMFDWTQQTTIDHQFYAMSGILTVPGDVGAVPEATSLLTWGLLGVTFIVGSWHLRDRNQIAA